MARSNADFSRWVVHELSEQQKSENGRIVEIGSGPGVGLEEALKQFPRSRVWGVDLSPEMASQARSRNRMSVRAGRLSLTVGGVARLAEIAPIDLVFANHVLYFWHDPEAELRQIRAFLRPAGLLTLGYQLKQNMPVMAQKYFPRDGHLLYETNDQIDGVLRGAGFSNVWGGRDRYPSPADLGVDRGNGERRRLNKYRREAGQRRSSQTQRTRSRRLSRGVGPV